MQDCPHCAEPVFTVSTDGTRLKAPTTMLILHKSGGVEINCGSCKRGIILPLQPVEGDVSLKKARSKPRFFVRKGS
jgi:hypothetical protein